MDTTIGSGERSGRLKIIFTVSRQGPDPKGLARWDVFEKRYLIVEVLIGNVLAGSRDEAMAKAKAQWPHVKKLSVAPAEPEE